VWGITTQGTEGFDEARALVVSESIDPDGFNTYRARLTFGPVPRVGWAAKVVSWNAGTRTATVDGVNTDLVTAGFSLRLLSHTGALKEAGHLVQSVTATTVRFTTAPTAVPIAGDYLTGDTTPGVEEEFTGYQEEDAWTR
jgi:hypothetical protein